MGYEEGRSGSTAWFRPRMNILTNWMDLIFLRRAGLKIDWMRDAGPSSGT